MMNLRKLLRANRLSIIMFFIVFSIAGCNSFFNETDNFNPREHPVIMADDTLVYIGTESIDSFYVWKSQIESPPEYDGYEEDYEQYKGLMSSGTYADTSMVIEITIINFRYSLFYYYPRRNVAWDPVGSVVSINKQNGKYSLQIANYKIDNLHKAVFKKEEYDLFSEIDTAYYSKTYGFVKYIKYTGEEFVLSEESLEMLMARK